MTNTPSNPDGVGALTIEGFGENFSAAMDARTVTVRGLADEIGVDKSAISRARRGKAVSQAHFIALWNWLHASPQVDRGVSTAEGEAGADGELDEGINYAIERLCEILDVDPKSISWDAATETMDGDVSSVICNALRAAYGEDWSTKPEDTARIRAVLAFPVAYHEPPLRDTQAGLSSSGDREAEPAGKWHDIGYLMSVIDAAIEDGFDPDEDGPVLDEIRAEVEAGLHRLTPVREEGVAPGVKPLEWSNDAQKGRYAEGVVGALAYMAFPDTSGTWRTTVYERGGPNTLGGFFGTEDAAKAAAQADYEARILSALLNQEEGK